MSKIQALGATPFLSVRNSQMQRNAGGLAGRNHDVGILAALRNRFMEGDYVSSQFGSQFRVSVLRGRCRLILSSDDHCVGAGSLQSGSDSDVESAARLDRRRMDRVSGVVVYESTATC